MGRWDAWIESTSSTKVAIEKMDKFMRPTHNIPSVIEILQRKVNLLEFNFYLINQRMLCPFRAADSQLSNYYLLEGYAKIWRGRSIALRKLHFFFENYFGLVLVHQNLRGSRGDWVLENSMSYVALWLMTYHAFPLKCHNTGGIFQSCQ